MTPSILISGNTSHKKRVPSKVMDQNLRVVSLSHVNLFFPLYKRPIEQIKKITQKTCLLLTSVDNAQRRRQNDADVVLIINLSVTGRL